MGHIDNEPLTPQRSTSPFILSIPTTTRPEPKPSDSGQHNHEKMETKPRFDGMRFDSQIFDLYVGPEKRHFAVHRAVLNQSPQFRSLCNTQALSKNGGAKARTTLSMERDDPRAIGHLLEYLYTNKFTVRGAEPLDEAKQLADLYLLASTYTLPGLQEAVITQLESSHTSSKITAMQFFNMAEDLYSEEPHVAMREYFAKVAPGLLRTVAEGELQELLRMISEGGDFATDLFAAHHQAFGPGHLPASHPESETQDGPLSKSEKTDEPSAGPVDIRTAWDDAHEIPSFWHEMTAADQLLVTMREEGKTWNEIDHAQTEKHGKSGSISEWVSRYGRISINMAHMRLKKGDVDRLFAAKEQIETRFQLEKWSSIADLMEQNGAGRYRPDFLRKKFKDLELALKAREQAKAFSISNTRDDTSRAVAGNDKDLTNVAVDRATIGPANENGTANRARNRAASVIVIDEIVPATQNRAATGTAGGGSARTMPTRQNPATSGTAHGPASKPATEATHSRALDRAHCRIPKEPSDKPTTGDTSTPPPKDTKKRTFTAMKDSNAGAPPRGNATSTKAPVEVKAEKVRKTATGAEGGHNQKVIEARGLGSGQKVADPEHVALNDDDSMSENN